MTSIELLTRKTTASKTQRILSYLNWSNARIRVKILAPLVILMALSLVVSVVGFVFTTTTTRNQLIDEQLIDESQRLISILNQSENDLETSARLLSKDPQLTSALVDNDVIAMQSRARSVLDLYRIDRVIVLNEKHFVRTNIATHSDLSALDFYDTADLQECDVAQMNLVHEEKNLLVVARNPIWSPQQHNDVTPSLIGCVYTVHDVARLVERTSRELGLSSEITIMTTETITSKQPSELPIETSTSVDGYRVQVLSQPLANNVVNILFRISEQQINQIVWSGFQVMMITSIITCILLAGIGFWLSQGIMRPIQELVHVVEAVGEGDLTSRVRFTHHDEIGQLGRAFDKATETISDLLEQQARTASERHAILQSIADGLLAVDTEQRIMIVNPVAANLLEQQHHNLLHKPIDVLTQQHNPLLESGLQHIVDQIKAELVTPQQPKQEEHISLGNRVVRLHSAPILGSNNKRAGAVMVLQDITQAVEADRAKSAFIGIASHEMRTPLASMKGFVDIFYLSGTENLTENQHMFLDTIRRQTENLVQLVNDLLEVARLEQGSQRGEQRWVAIPPVCHEAITSLNAHIEKRGITISIEIEKQLPSIWIDTLHLRRIITNILSNAVKYVRYGGMIQVHVLLIDDATQLPSAPIDDEWYSPTERSVLIMVRDNGVGIRASDHAKIFTRFFRSDNPLSVEAGGSGLGLAITKSLVMLHKGQIGFHSVEDEGSCFWVRLPVADVATLEHTPDVL